HSYRRVSRRKLRVSETTEQMIVDHTDRLHESVTNGRAHEFESSLAQIFTHPVRFGRCWRNLLQRTPGIHAWSAAYKLPDIAIKRSKLILELEKCFSILYRGSQLQFVAHQPRITHQALQP